MAKNKITAVLGPTNTGKTFLAIETMLSFDSGMIGFPLRLLAREVYDKIIKKINPSNVALITGEEKIIPSNAKYYLCTVESMPIDKNLEFVGIDEIQMCADHERGHIFTDRLLNLRGEKLTMLMGSNTIKNIIINLNEDTEFVNKERLSKLSYKGHKKISRMVKACVINAGDGSHEHPTQALLDALTIKKKFGSFIKLKIAICGDILHSRVARSNIEILSTLGAKINIIGPKTLIPIDIQQSNIKIYYNMKAGLKNCDIVMMLRIQKERIVGKHFTNEKEYFKKYGLDYKKLGYAKKQALVMHPGPMNRGIEIDSKLADDVTRSLIQEQVSMGVAIRMACLEILINNKDKYGS